MRKTVLRLSAFALDAMIFWAAIRLFERVSGGLLASQVGVANVASVVLCLAVAGALALHLSGYSIGERLLAFPIKEEESGVKLRQWPNLVLGFLMFYEGLKFIIGASSTGIGMPAMLMVQDSVLKMLAMIASGVLTLIGAVLLLGFRQGARKFNFIWLLVFTAIAAATYALHWDQFASALIAFNEFRGVTLTREMAASYVRGGMYMFFGQAAIRFLLLYLCRERVT